MKRVMIVWLGLLSALHVTAAVAKSITCTYPQDQELTFDVPKKLGGLPSIEFDLFVQGHTLQFPRQQSAVGRHG